MTRLASLLVVGVLAGCASSGPVPLGQGVYSDSKTSPACGFRSADGTKAELFKEADSFCSSRSLDMSILKVVARDGVIGARCASAEVQFQCVARGSPPHSFPTINE